MLTNKIIVNYNVEAIDRDFDIFEVKNENPKFDRNYLDVQSDDPDYKAISVAYTFGTSYYMMFRKGAMTEARLREIMIRGGNESCTTQHVDLHDKEYCDSHFFYGWRILFKLFINAFANDFEDGDKYNNLAGKLLYFNPDWYDPKKGKDSIVRVFLNIDVDKGMLLDAKAETYVMENITFRSAEHVPYLFDERTKQFRRITTSDKNVERAFFKKELKGHKAQVDFLGLNEDSFEKSKANAIYEVIQWLREQKEYLYFHFENINVSNSMPSIQGDFDVKDYIPRLNLRTIRIINSIGNDGEKLKKELVNSCKKWGIKCRVASKVEKSKYNFVIIHNQDYYKDNQIEDPHKNDYKNAIVQHVTLEDMHIKKKDKEKTKKDDDVSPAFRVILTDLLIKEDIINKQLTLVDWPSLGLDKDVFFVNRNTKTADDGIMRYIYAAMRIKPDGTFRYDYTKTENLTDWDNDDAKYSKYFKRWDDKLDRSIDLVAFADNHNVYQIRNTGKRVMPDIENIGEIFDATKPDKMLDVNRLVPVITRFGLEKPEYNDYVSALKEEVMKQGPHITKGELRSLINIRCKAGKDFAAYYEKLTDEKLISKMKWKGEDPGRLNSMIGACYYRTPPFDNEFNPNSFSYYVGLKDFGDLKFSLSRSCLIREIRRRDGRVPDEEVVRKLLALTQVGFVRLNNYTVVPFIRKYLKEILRYWELRNPRFFGYNC